jgi:hypothetical protein
MPFIFFGVHCDNLFNFYLRENNEEDDKNFSDDEFSNLKESKRASSIGKSSSKVSLSLSDESDVGSASESEDSDFLENEDSTEEANSKILSKFGYDFKSLVTATVKKNENGNMIRYKPPLIASLFVNTPPKLNFVTHDDKSKTFEIIQIKR